jgi:DNA primase
VADDWADLIRQIKESNDIVDVVGNYVSLRPAGPTYKGLCPFHDDHTPSFDVDPRRQRYRCWSCTKSGDVLSFIQEHDRISFREAMELLARRAGISLEKNPKFRQNPDRAGMLDLLRWSCEQFHQCLLDDLDPQTEAARRYLGERHFTGETIRRYALGFAPADGSWFVTRAANAGKSAPLLEKLGMIARRDDGSGYYGRFRDRIMFPIRDARGQTVGFGGRILPSSPSSERAPKYYNSSDSPLFSKSEQLYGIDQARVAGADAGFLAVVEGYTDVLMAHQLGILPVVATMGTALNARHVRQLRRFVPRVILVFDADEGGETGVDRALEIFASQDVELAVATMPAGLDPFDLLITPDGPEQFKLALANAVDALEFKLRRVLASADGSVESRRRAIDSVLKVLALTPDLVDQGAAVKRDLMLTRIAQRMGVEEATIRKRLSEMRGQAREREQKKVVAPEPPAERAAPAPQHEKDLLQVLLAEPGLVPEAATAVAPEHLEHPGLKQLLEGLYSLHNEGATADLDHLRVRIDNPRLVETALRFQEIGRMNPDRPGWLRLILAEYKKRQLLPEKRELQNQLRAAVDHTDAIEKLRRLQTRPDF